MILSVRNLLSRPWRTLLLLGGFGIGVGVMIVLLAIGDAMLTQARDEKLVGGGQVTVLPEGLDVEVMKTGGIGGLYFSIPNARFVDRQLLSSPRLHPVVRAVAPQIEGKLLYLRAQGREVAVRGTGEIPSRSAAVGAAPALVTGTWEDDALDRRWIDPAPAELRDDIDHFHLPPPGLADAARWAEWHYFNVLSADHTRWAFITLAIGGDVPDGQWGGQVLVTLHGRDLPDRRYAVDVAPQRVRFSTTAADLTVGASSVTLDADGRYRVVAVAPAADGGGDSVTVDVVVTPSPREYFPGVELGGDAIVSGYVVPALRAAATGRICGGRWCEALDGVQSYHDHNWGVWRRVDWEWGAGRAGDFTVLYGRVQPGGEAADLAPLLLYVTDSLGFVALVRPRTISYEDGRAVRVGGRTIRVPSRFVLADARGADTLRLEVEVQHATATDTRADAAARGDTTAARDLAHPYFIQMKGIARLTGRVDGRPIAGTGTGFFETYR